MMTMAMFKENENEKGKEKKREMKRLKWIWIWGLMLRTSFDFNIALDFAHILRFILKITKSRTTAMSMHLAQIKYAQGREVL